MYILLAGHVLASQIHCSAAGPLQCSSTKYHHSFAYPYSILPSIPAAKRQKKTEDEMSEQRNDEEMLSASGSGSGSEPEEAGFSSDGGSSSAASEPDTEDEIAEAKLTKSKKTLKRKRRATDAVNFGATLQSLLTTDAPEAPLSLKPSLARKRKEEKLEAKGKQVLQIEKKEKEEKGHITDVIGGWGGESERALRKVAQRGVVKLFNAIQQSQAAQAAAAEELKAQRGTGKPTLPAPTFNDKKKKGKHKDSVVTKAQETNLGQDDFLDIIRSGGIVSRA
ncbi:Rrp15p-domain-containing protein [Cubamyces lactineus]|nr:Rrp15p-domain-containing protein [Cubamyces lactineus]